MASISRSSILTTVVVVTLVAAVPGAIRRYHQTGTIYMFSQRFFEDVMARFSGPGRFRFVMQPLVSIFLARRDGLSDARSGLPPFLLGLIYHSAHRVGMLRTAIASVRDLVAIAILLDVISQFLIFRQVNPFAALLIGPVLIALPYSVTRAVTNGIVSRRAGATAPPAI